jgi:predicted AlkP superfamily phosphohydrolase/phosphomutase/tetratricopeptide (TPR) repeat protein
MGGPRGRPCSFAYPSSMSERLAKRLLIIGWDAADWKMIDPLLGQGLMPNLTRLLARGVRAELASLDPKLSPILWTSIATGKTADKHGILNFVEPDPAGGSVRIVTSTSRKTKALWNILSQSNLRTLVVNWYASHPAEPILGVCVANTFQQGCPRKATEPWLLPPGARHPAECALVVEAARVHPATIPRHELLNLIPRLDRLPHDDRRIDLLRRLLAQCQSVHNVARSLLAAESWDCAMVFYDMVDVAGHHFMQYHAPRMPHVSSRDYGALSDVMNNVYRLHDRMLGELLKDAGEDTTVMLLSDHGFHSDHLRPKVQSALDDEHAAMDATWHRPIGVLAMGGPGVQHGRDIHSPSLLDITPTALTLLGLTVGEDMDGRVLAEALAVPVEIERVASWDTMPGEAGLHPADLRQDPVEATEALRQLADLGYIEPIGDDAQRAIEQVDRETRFNLGVVYMSTRRPHAALPVFERLHAECPTEARFAMNRAHCLQAAGRLAEAGEVLLKFVAADPNNAAAEKMRAAVLAAQGRADDAVRSLQALTSQHPNDVEALVMLGQALAQVGRWADADAAIDRAIARDPQSAHAHHTRATVHLLQQRFEQAAEACLNALEIRRLFPEAHYTLGVALAWLNELSDAAQSFRLALSMQPGVLEAHRYLQHLCRRLGDPDGAERHAREAARLEAQLSAPTLAAADQAPFSARAWAAQANRAANPA